MRPLLLVLVAFAIPLPAGRAELRRGPYVQAVTPTAATVCFETDEETEGVVEHAGGSAKSPRGKRHEIRLEGLKPGTRYGYSVQPGGAKGSFKTAPDGDGEVFFIAWGDSRTYYDRLARIAALAAKDGPDFSIHSGDLVDEGTFEGDWDKFFEAAAPLLSAGAFWPSIGNHDTGARQYFDLFVLPAPEHWYTFVYGPVQFFILDSNYDQRAKPAQLAWAKEALARSTARFKVAMLHHPLVSCPADDFGFDRESGMYALYGRIFEEAKVTAVFQGHNHNYQRAERNGVLYITTGGGGAPLYPIGDLTPETKFTRVAHHYCRVRLKGATMTLEAVDLAGQVFDRDERSVK